MKARIISAGRVASRVRLGRHDLTFDQPSTTPGGADTGPSPLDVMAASVAACAHYYAAAFLYARGLPTAELTVDAEWEKDRVPAPRIGKLRIDVRVPAGLSTHELASIERAIKACPAYGTLRYPPSVDFAIGEPAGAHDERLSA
jgi:uncharacterized OsmC-like protein